jgi:vacuolar-type H+-ATPase subunit H
MDNMNVVEDLQSLVDTGTRVPGFRNKVLVDVGRLMALGQDWSGSVPAMVQEAKEILNQRDSIINQAYLEAQRIKGSAEQGAVDIAAAAEKEHIFKVDETEIVKAAEAKAQGTQDEAMMESSLILQDAQRKAYQIQEEAEATADSRRDGADRYTREVLFNLEEQLAEALGQVRRGIDSLRPEEVPAQQIEETVAA